MRARHPPVEEAPDRGGTAFHGLIWSQEEEEEEEAKPALRL